MKHKKFFYITIGSIGLLGCCVSTYGIFITSPTDSNLLTFSGLLIAFVSIMLSVIIPYDSLVGKEKDDVEFEKLTTAINGLKISIEETNKKIVEIDNKISNNNRKYHSTDQNNTFSLITIDLNQKKDLKCK